MFSHVICRMFILLHARKCGVQMASSMNSGSTRHKIVTKFEGNGKLETCSENVIWQKKIDCNIKLNLQFKHKFWRKSRCMTSSTSCLPKPTFKPKPKPKPNLQNKPDFSSNQLVNLWVNFWLVCKIIRSSYDIKDCSCFSENHVTQYSWVDQFASS